MARRPLSLQARSLLAAGVVLAAFLGLTGIALDQAISRTLLESLHDRLQSYAYGYLATSEVSRSLRWTPPEMPPDSRLDSPGSGLYASVVGPVEVDGARFSSWRSQSAYDITDIPPFDETLRPGAERFTETAITGSHGRVYVYS
jgi:two-component system sensor histidine kinase PhoQ